MDDERYGYGETCTWHGPLTFASPAVTIDGANDNSEDALACPQCGLRLHSMGVAAFWDQVRRTDANELPGYEAMMRWSENKCFPDFDTLQSAYRQAMEGTT